MLSGTFAGCSAGFWFCLHDFRVLAVSFLGRYGCMVSSLSAVGLLHAVLALPTPLVLHNAQ